MAASDDTSEPTTLAEANRNTINYLREKFEDRFETLEDELSDLEAENTKLRRELAELKDGGNF